MKKQKETNGKDCVVKDVVIHVLRHDIWLKILTVVSIGLIVAGFICPPLAIIDGSVLTATGILAAFGALFEAGHAIERGLDAKLKIKDIELAISNDETERKRIEFEKNIEEE